MSNENVNLLVAMGFNETSARRALNETAGNIEQAANFLLAGGGETASSFETPFDIPTQYVAVPTIQGTTSQYNVDNGRSACTCMALSAATQFLTDKTYTITPDFLNAMVGSGSAVYAEWRASSSSHSVDHTSPEETLFLFPRLTLLSGGIRQGLAQRRIDRTHPLGWYAILSDCRSPTDWICLVITKPPETVLVCLPPSGVVVRGPHASEPAIATAADETSHEASAIDAPNALSFYLIDSHPRPTQFQTHQAYCRSHVSLEQLIESLQILFPATDLGNDNDMMAAMYNSFDVYPLMLSS